MNARGAALVTGGFATLGAVRLGVLVACAAACGGSSSTGRTSPATLGDGEAPRSARVGAAQLLRRDVEEAIGVEKATLAALDREIDELEAREPVDEAMALRVIVRRADRVARASYAAQLEACLTVSTECPPSLAEPRPPVDWDAAGGELTGAFVASAERWPDESARLERDACGCRTADCVDWVMADLERWESGLPLAASGGDVVAEHVTAARQCLWRRLGKQ